MELAENATTIMMANTTAPLDVIPAKLGLLTLGGILPKINGWQIAATILMILVAYDQCQSSSILDAI